MAQNKNMEQMTSYIESAKRYNIPTDNKTVKGIFEVTNKRGIKASYDDSLFTSENQNAIWKINEDGTREVILNPNAKTEKTLQSVTVH